MKYLITNFVYGTGPYLRTTELALSVNSELEKIGKERLGIIVPWVYGEKQKRIMLEEFGEFNKKYPSEILLCESLGKILSSIFYGDNTYEDALKIWVDNFDIVNSEAKKILSGHIMVEDLDGAKFEISGSDIVFELNRSGRVDYGTRISYGVTFGNISEILKNTLLTSEESISVNRGIVKKAIPLAEKIESRYRIICLAYPGTFSYLKDRKKVGNEISIPPTIFPPKQNSDNISEGIFVTITGIPGLERLYGEAKKLGLKLYSNDIKTVPGSEKLLPHVVPNPRIKLQFARSGWGSVWLSMLSGTPFVAPDFDPKDDPEIYFNNKCIEEFGLGIIYRGQSLNNILVNAEKLRPKIQEMNRNLINNFGTLNGNEYSARIIVDDIVKNNIL